MAELERKSFDNPDDTRPFLAPRRLDPEPRSAQPRGFVAAVRLPTPVWSAS